MLPMACNACLEFVRCDCKSKKVAMVSIAAKKKEKDSVPNFVDVTISVKTFYFIYS